MTSRSLWVCPERPSATTSIERPRPVFPGRCRPIPTTASSRSSSSAEHHYRADAPIAIQWDTPLPGAGSYPVALTLDLRTTYADGTVRASTVSGTVGVTVIYSAVDQ